MNNKAAKTHLQANLEKIEAAQEQAIRQRIIYENAANDAMRQAENCRQQEAALKEEADAIREILSPSKSK